MKNDETTTNEITNNLFSKDFYCSEIGYFQITIVNGKVYFAQKTFPQICNLLASKNDKGETIHLNDAEKLAYKTFLDNDRQIVLSELIINYVYCFTDTIQTPYIMHLDQNKIDVFVPTQLQSKIQDNSIWEIYLSDRFGDYKQFAKQWISAFCYFSEYRYKNHTKNKRLPIMILVGNRSVGKTSFIELLSKIFGENNYAKISKEVFAQRFDNWKSNKLVHLNESSKLNCDQYEKLKLTMGSELIEVEKKGKDRIHAKNNISMIIDSNKKNPIYTVLAELPVDTTENQFFVTEFKELQSKNDKQLQLLKDSFYNYIDTELRSVFELEVLPNMDNVTWTIDTPITKEETQMFLINKTNQDYYVEEIVNVFYAEYLNKNVAFISNDAIGELANRLNAKNVNYFKNDLKENGLISPKSKTDYVIGIKKRGYDINRDTVNRLYGNNPIQANDIGDTEYFDTESRTNIFKMV
jgi:hypothetical protein